MIAEIDHFNIVVKDLDRSIEFYKLLGFKVVKQASLNGAWIENVVQLKGVNAKVAYLVGPTLKPRLELLCYDSPAAKVVAANSMANTPGLRHLAFRVKGIMEIYQKMVNAGVAFSSPPQEVPANALTHKEGKKTLCYFYDPDGVLLELAEYN